MPSISCKCGEYFSTGSFPMENGFKVFSEVDYDNIEDPVTRKSLEALYLRSKSIYKCPNCYRFIVIGQDGILEFWSKE